MKVHLVRDVLDKRIVDRHGARLGRVDGIVLEIREKGPPRVTEIETGAVTLASRLGRWAEKLIRAIKRRIGLDEDPVRFPFEAIKKKGIDLRLPVEASETRALEWERWVAEHIVDRIPGSGR